MSINRKFFQAMIEDEDFKEYEYAKATHLSGLGVFTPTFKLKKSELERKIDDFSTIDGIRVISNSERKKLIEQEIEENAKKNR